MSESSDNPYAAPNSTESIRATEQRSNRFGPLWGWLVVAVLAGYFGTPADPVSMLIALAYGLASFCVGCVLGSLLDLRLRVLILILWLVPGAFVGVILSGVFFIGDMACFALLSIGMGFWACQALRYGRLRILAAFCVGFVIGSFAGLIGTVFGAVTATMLANRSMS